MKFAIMGLGGRGATYAHFIKYYGSQVVAVCDADRKKMPLAAKYGVENGAFYDSEEEFFAKGKLADCLVIATLDTLHYRQAMKALELGYDILLEKPIALTLSECQQIRDKAIALQRRVVVCHVLRYAPFYIKIKELLDSKAFGEVISLQMTENIGYYHYAHSYVRGNWRNEKISAPLILAKNCHDLDMICWLLGTECESVSSQGSLRYFKKENAPKDASMHCVDCVYKDSCKYSAFAIYNNAEYEKIAGLAKHGGLGENAQEINAKLQDKNNIYARCVFHCDNDVCDNQMVNMTFENGVTAQFQSIAFSQELQREIKIYCADGVIWGGDGGDIYYQRLGGEGGCIPITFDKGGYGHHAGGDSGIVKQLIEYLEKGIKRINITDIARSVLSHEIGFAAEASRKQQGKVIYLK
jgi:predicted dehydrogenase